MAKKLPTVLLCGFDERFNGFILQVVSAYIRETECAAISWPLYVHCITLSRTNGFENKFFMRMPCWNALPNFVVTVNSILCFKKLLQNVEL